jgi:hypothetical protein
MRLRAAKTAVPRILGRIPTGRLFTFDGPEPVPGPSRPPPGRAGTSTKWSRPGARKSPEWAGHAYGWMSNLGRAGGTRTHDPRIMSLGFDILPHASGYCFVPQCPGSASHRIRSVPPGCVACQPHPSHLPPATSSAGLTASLPPVVVMGGRNGAWRCGLVVRPRGRDAPYSSPCSHCSRRQSPRGGCRTFDPSSNLGCVPPASRPGGRQQRRDCDGAATRLACVDGSSAPAGSQFARVLNSCAQLGQ